MVHQIDLSFSMSKERRGTFIESWGHDFAIHSALPTQLQTYIIPSNGGLMSPSKPRERGSVMHSSVSGDWYRSRPFHVQ